MSNIVTIGLHCEGTTDERFLLSVIKRTFDAVALECHMQLEVYEPERVPSSGGGFVEAVKKAASDAHAQGLMVLCVHADADSTDDRNTFDFKIIPAFAAVEETATQNSSRSVLVAVVPVRMTEAWMLADVELLCGEIGITPDKATIPSRAETDADPKATIKEIIRQALADRPRRQRDQLHIGDLYQPIGQKLAMDRLERLASYQKFKEGVRGAYRQLNYLV